MSNLTTNYRDPQDLTIHAALKSQPRLADDHPTMLAMRKGMKRSGLDSREILITGQNEIVDGRHWWWNAKKLAWDKVRVRVVDDNQIHAVILDTLANRRHYAKGQLAYIVAPMLADVFAEAKKRQLAAMGSKESASVLHSVQNDAPTPEAVAASMGISYRVLAQAQEVHTLFSGDKTKRTMTDRDGNTEKGVTLREFFEPRILLEEDPESPSTRAYGLGAVLAGIKSLSNMERKETPHGGGKPKAVEKQLQLFTEGINGFTAKFDYFKKWEPETQQIALGTIAPAVEKMPDQVLAEFAKSIGAEQKRRKK